MKTLSKILLAGTLMAVPIASLKSDAGIKSDTAKIATVVALNRIRKEKWYPLFVIPKIKGNSQTLKANFKDDYGNLHNREIEVRYSLKKDANNFYYTVSPKDYDRTNWKGSGKERLHIDKKYSRINESSSLMLFYDKNIYIGTTSQQGTFAKQNSWNPSKTYVEKKGLIELSRNYDAKYIVGKGEDIIDGTIKIIPGLKNVYKKFISKSMDKVKKDSEKLAEHFGKEMKIMIIPTYVPDKLTGQTLTSLEYRIRTSGNGKIFFYHITNFGNHSDTNNTTGYGSEGFAQIKSTLNPREDAIEKTINVGDPKTMYFIDLETQRVDKLKRSIPDREKRHKFFRGIVKTHDIYIKNSPRSIEIEHMRGGWSNKIKRLPTTIQTKEKNIYSIIKIKDGKLYYKKLN